MSKYEVIYDDQDPDEVEAFDTEGAAIKWCQKQASETQGHFLRHGTELKIRSIIGGAWRTVAVQAELDIYYTARELP